MVTELAGMGLTWREVLNLADEPELVVNDDGASQRLGPVVGHPVGVGNPLPGRGEVVRIRGFLNLELRRTNGRFCPVTDGREGLAVIARKAPKSGLLAASY